MGRRYRSVVATVIALTLSSYPSVSAGRALPLPDEQATDSETSPAPARGYRRAFVHFRPDTPHQDSILRANDLRPVAAFESVDVVFAAGPATAFDRIARDRRVTHLEADRKLSLLNDSAVVATRVTEARATEGPYRDPGGAMLDGTGVGVAVVDTGILALHPDLSSRVGKNYKVVCAAVCTFTETPVGDFASGHGTHVAGIVAGTGTQSDGRFEGVAPGATIYGFGVGDTLYVVWAARAFEYILQHYAEFDPRIRVITNSYGAPDPYDPDSVMSKLVREVIGRGTTVVWAAGNSGGNGSENMLTDYARDPTPGVVSVGNYDDNNSGTRDGTMYSGSSRGLEGSPDTYPDIAAPGTRITSTCIQEIQPVCNLGFSVTTAHAPWYATVGGTSMAAPHVAGVAALLYQADPALTPAGVEDLLQDSAYKFSAGAPYEPDPQNIDGTVAYDKGAGLVDAAAALELLRTPKKPQRPRPRKRKQAPKKPSYAM